MVRIALIYGIGKSARFFFHSTIILVMKRPGFFLSLFRKTTYSVKFNINRQNQRNTKNGLRWWPLTDVSRCLIMTSWSSARSAWQRAPYCWLAPHLDRIWVVVRSGAANAAHIFFLEPPVILDRTDEHIDDGGGDGDSSAATAAVDI